MERTERCDMDEAP